REHSLDLAVRPPDYRLKAAHLKRRGRGAARIDDAILGNAADLPQVINPEDIGVFAARQVGKRRQCAVSPNGCTGHTVSRTERVPLTEIFAIRIERGYLGTHRYLAKRANSRSAAVACCTDWKERWAQDAQTDNTQVAFLLAPQGGGSGESICL